MNSNTRKDRIRKYVSSKFNDFLQFDRSSIKFIGLDRFCDFITIKPFIKIFKKFRLVRNYKNYQLLKNHIENEMQVHKVYENSQKLYKMVL